MLRVVTSRLENVDDPVDVTLPVRLPVTSPVRSPVNPLAVAVPVTEIPVLVVASLAALS